MIKLLPLEKLLLETDSPALSFEPGKMNQPKNLRISAEIIAKIKKVDVDTVIKQTTLNAFKLFPRKVSFRGFSRPENGVQSKVDGPKEFQVDGL